MSLISNAPGPRNLITDIPGLLVGNARHDDLRSGVSVLVGPGPLTAGVHIMGGAPGTRETALLAPDRLVQQVDALVLSGGSAFGLDAASGVMERLRAEGRGFAVGDIHVPIVPAAILFDLSNGGKKDWRDNPYKALGESAFDNLGENFELGSQGAGTGASTAGLKGGLGSASWVMADGTRVAALVAVNALGSACVGDGPHFWAAPFEEIDEFGGLGPALAYPPTLPTVTKRGGGATTIAIVATDAPLDQAELTRMATAAHDGIARALVPAHTLLDGDLVFAVTTGQGAPADPLEIGHAAASCLARAIARAVYLADSHQGDLTPSWRSRFG